MVGNMNRRKAHELGEDRIRKLRCLQAIRATMERHGAPADLPEDQLATVLEGMLSGNVAQPGVAIATPAAPPPLMLTMDLSLPEVPDQPQEEDDYSGFGMMIGQEQPAPAPTPAAAGGGPVPGPNGQLFADPSFIQKAVALTQQRLASGGRDNPGQPFQGGTAAPAGPMRKTSELTPIGEQFKLLDALNGPGDPARSFQG